MQVEFTNQARSDLVSIGLFIAGDNPTRAKSFVMELRSACRTLAESADRFVVVSINDGGAIYRMPHRAY
ncbi:MAG: type II toxin-antitoxin system RelE/ParE family toxin [Phyllobacteriaceae bacterium]|nr:type II toxin-antitoxin system RelE/ParE family toxin [Phyllobacteriaceae bacterium]